MPVSTAPPFITNGMLLTCEGKIYLRLGILLLNNPLKFFKLFWYVNFQISKENLKYVEGGRIG